MELEGKVAVITGGASGIGRAISQRCVEEGAAVAILGHSDDEGRRAEAQLRALASSLWNNPEVKSGEEKIDPDEVGQPVQVAEAVLFLGSARASFIKGTVLSADGGRLPMLCSHAHAAS